MRPTFVDLSHPVVEGMQTYPGLPGPRLGTVLSRADSRSRYAPGVEFHIGSIELCTNTGTYLDTPAHRFEDGWDLSALELDRCAELPLVVVDLPDGGPAHRGFEAADLPGAGLAGAAVLLRTGWSVHWGTATYAEPTHPFLTAGGARALAEAGAALVGIDALNIDDTSGRDRPAHTILLEAGIPIVEHLTNLSVLSALDSPRTTFTAVPVKIAGLGTFPVRAYATVWPRPEPGE